MECAVALQQSWSDSERKLPQERRFVFRAGITLGDVIFEDDDVYGDGVNLAVRFEGLAEPGGICLSEDAYRQVRNKVDAGFEDLGERVVKNIAEPVHVYRIESRQSPLPPIANRSATLLLHDKPSIAVLPFTSMSDAPEQDYFAEGLAQDIITELARASSQQCRQQVWQPGGARRFLPDKEVIRAPHSKLCPSRNQTTSRLAKPRC